MAAAAAAAAPTGYWPHKLLYFVFFAGKGVLEPYLPVFFEIMSMSKAQIGVLSMLPCLNAFVFAPLFGVIADTYGIHREVILLTIGASVLCTLLMLSAHTFVAMLLVVFAASAFRAPTTPQVDALVMNSLDDRGRYGEMRLWGAVSFGIFSFLGGALTQAHTLASFEFNFFCHAALFLLSGGVVYYISRAVTSHKALATNSATDESTNPPPLPLGQALWRVYRDHPSVVVFGMIVFLSGIGAGVIDAFLFVRLKQLGGSGMVMGVSRFITCAAEVPMFQIAGGLQRRHGTYRVLALTQLAFVLRFTYYALLTEPWAVLPCEVLHGLTYAITWSVACTYANIISPPECHSTMQALLEGLHWGFGSGLGALMGGFVYDRYGPVWLFEMSASLSFLSLLLALLAVKYAEPDHVEEDAPTEYAAVDKSEHGSLVFNALPVDSAGEDEGVELGQRSE